MLRQIENLVFSGGGQRTLYGIPVIECLEDKGLLDHLKNIAVTSAGGTPGLALALSYNAEEMTALLKKYAFYGGTHRNLSFIPEHIASDQPSPYYQIDKNEHYLNRVGKTIANAGTYSYLFGKGVANMFLAQGLFDTKGFEEAYWYIIRDCPHLAHLSEKAKRGLTFKQLHDLKINFTEKKFIDLYVMTVEEVSKKKYKLHVCSYKTEPNMPILQALIDSARLPHLFRKQKGREKLFWDGGILKNLARDLFDDPEYFGQDDRLTDMNMRTLAIRFAKSQEEIAAKRDNISPKPPGLWNRMVTGVIRGFINFLVPLDQIDIQELEDQQGANSLRTLYLNSGNISIISTYITDDDYAKMREYAKKETEQFINNYFVNVVDPHINLNEIRQVTNSTKIWNYFYPNSDQLQGITERTNHLSKEINHPPEFLNQILPSSTKPAKDVVDDCSHLRMTMN